jgi:hypothetical protein
MIPSRKWALLVAYGYTEDTQRRWLRFLQQAGLDPAHSLVLDNKAPALLGVLAGSNLHFEFSGYSELLEHVSDSLAAEDVVYVFNDTLFSHHWTRGWAQLIQENSMTLSGIYGDPRLEPVELDGRPLRILASWHFALHGQNAVATLQQALTNVCSQFDRPIKDPAYQAYQANYLQPRWWGGYTKVLKPEALAIKQRCIWAEHRLSRKLEESTALQAYPNGSYPQVHLMDRLLAAGRRLTNLFQA